MHLESYKSNITKIGPFVRRRPCYYSCRFWIWLGTKNQSLFFFFSILSLKLDATTSTSSFPLHLSTAPKGWHKFPLYRAFTHVVSLLILVGRTASKVSSGATRQFRLDQSLVLRSHAHLTYGQHRRRLHPPTIWLGTKNHSQCSSQVSLMHPDLLPEWPLPYLDGSHCDVIKTFNSVITTVILIPTIKCVFHGV